MSEARELLKSILYYRESDIPLFLIDKIDAYLAIPDHEPFGWFIEEKGIFVYGKNSNDEWVNAGYTVTPLYADQLARKPLRNNEIDKIIIDLNLENHSGLRSFARAIEKAHGIGVDK